MDIKVQVAFLCGSKEIKLNLRKGSSPSFASNIERI